ncbi:hypothetical protein GCM10017673_39980 [Streptosporangium violaceochromogenes]|nr:hypothetical protein GCM10017673_39980 [Streptosporangium violaceochromogenes]
MSERADYIRGLRALADLLEQHPHLPAATWTLDGGRLDGQLNGWQATLADRRAAIAAWSAALGAPLKEMRRYTTPTPDHAGNLSVEGCYLGAEVRVWVGLTAADLLALLRGVGQVEAGQVTPAQAVAAWNAAHPVGTPVRYWTDVREGEGKCGRTRTPASVLGGHTAVVWMEGEPSCVALTHVAPITSPEVTP